MTGCKLSVLRVCRVAATAVAAGVVLWAAGVARGSTKKKIRHQAQGQRKR